VENDASRDAQVVLILRAVAEFVETGEQVVHLNGADGKMMRDVDVDSATEGHRERIVRGREREAVAAADVRDAEQDLAERSEMRIVAIGNTRAEKVSGERAVHSRAENIVAVVAAKISNSAEPAVGVVGDGSAAAVEIETIHV
jgi:uncharacterized membrane-anchored protein